ncbi:MAG: SdiA-regulated domain-containing protein [Bacteroidota bacterium]|nr:SdiA-regulated domain-containing protein [Bacteroidota bacterium]
MSFLTFLLRIVPAALLLTIITPGCRSKTRVLKSPRHYNFSTPMTNKLDLKLKEISGITWDSKMNVFLAVNDELGKVFFLDKENKLITSEFEFGGKGDYEDLAVLNGIIYVLRSDGMITKLIKDSSDKFIGLEAGNIGLSGTNDFETMYSDTSRNALVLICKNCQSDDDTKVSAYAFYPDSIGFDSKPLYIIDATKAAALSPFKTSKLQPSAAAINPQLKKLFILSSASNQLVITDLNGKVEAVHKLSPKIFPQAEGITFKSNGDMYISNEGINTKASLLKFMYVAVSDTEKVQMNKSGYNFSKPDEKMELGKHLREISGMSYVPERSMILAENDEKGDIFMLDYKNKKDNEGKIKFGGKGDYEDIVYTDTAVYMLVSTGSVLQVKTNDSSFATREFILEKDGVNEFEAMYLDADGHSLILLCKDCDHEKNEFRMAHRFDLATNTFSSEPAYVINIADIKKILKDDEAEFKPSAGGINPINGKLYLVASVGKLLVIADRLGKVEQAIRLDPVLYNQPEGMTFAPNGDLYISNEGGDGIATILKFVYKK